MEMPTILMVCSWFDHRTPVGIFFREQAQILSKDYKFIIVNIYENNIGIRAFLKNILTKKVYINQHQTPEGIIIVYVSYLRWWFFEKKLKFDYKTKVINELFSYLENQKLNINLVHAQSLFNAGYWAYFIKMKKRIPYILTEHNQISLLGKTTNDYILINRILKNSSRNLVVSYDKIRQFATNGIYSDFFPVGNAINEEFFNYFPHGVQKDSFILTTIGAFSPIKDHATMIEAINLVCKKLPNINLIFNWIGFDGWGGKKESEIKILISKLNSSNITINLHNLLDRFEIARILKGTDMFLISSISEGMPVSVLEALACGVPVCSTKCGGVDEIIDNTNGYLVQIKDSEGMSEYIIKVIKGVVTFDRKEISKNILSKYGTKAFRENLKQYYEAALQETGLS